MIMDIVSWNVRSLGTQGARTKIFRYLSRFSSTPTILLLQEHHLSPSEIDDVAASLHYDVYSTTHLLTLIPPSLLSRLSHPPTTFPSFDGRVTYLQLSFNDLPPLEIANIYAPVNGAERLEFFRSLAIPHKPHHISVFGGDFNDCPNLEADRKNQTVKAHHWRVFEARTPVQLTDTIRHRHPSKPLYTRPHLSNGIIKSSSRIDHILLSSKHKTYLRDAHIRYGAPHSDHRPVVVRLDIPSCATKSDTLPSTNRLVTRINPLLFEDQDFESKLKEFYSLELRPRLSEFGSDVRWEYAKHEITSFASKFSRDRTRTRNEEQAQLQDELIRLEARDLDSDGHARWHETRTRLQELTRDKTKTLFLRTGYPHYPDATSNAQVLHKKLAARKASSTFTKLRLDDNATTTDISKALGQAHKKFSTHFTPSERNEPDVERARSQFLDPIRNDSNGSNPRFARRWNPAAAAQLDLPITEDEVKAAINSSPSSSSPGLLGLPYEFYKQNSGLVAADLAAAFNAAWDRGFLPPSQTEAQVRLLFKFQKPNADPSFLGHYRPISLRETDYRLLARVLVARLNPLLVDSIPRTQVGFVPGRDSSDAGLHLQLLIEEIRHRNLPRAALISLDQEAAYDRVDHSWVLECYRAFGAQPRFLRLLSAIYDEQLLRARYNINGFLTEPVRLRCGLPQGCPLSCASWLISFQPFLDALVHRDIVLSLTMTIQDPPRETATAFAFADDSIGATESLSWALPKLRLLSADWELATNGKLNADKTVVTAIGPEAKDDPLAGEMTWTDSDSFSIWAGFPLSSEPQPAAFYALLLEKIQRKATAASKLYSTLRTRAIYANTHIVSLVLHSLAFYPAPPTFLQQFRRVLLDFVWNSRAHAVKMEVVFLPVKLGGLGLLDPVEIDRANSFRRLDTLLSLRDPVWHDLAIASFLRHVQGSRRGITSPWAFFRKSSFSRIDHPLWKALAAVSDPAYVQLSPLAASTRELLSLPPSLFCDHPSLSSLNTIAQLYRTDRSSYFTLPASLSPTESSSSVSLRNARVAWVAFTSSHPIFSRHFPSSIPPIALLPPLSPTPSIFSFLHLAHGFSASDARLALISSKAPASFHSVFDLLPGGQPPEESLRRLWPWIAAPPATPRETETHWRILHRGLLTRSRQHAMGVAPSDSCVFCSPHSRDTIDHALFGCSYSSGYWTSILKLLHDDVDHRFSADTLSATQILLGLPKLGGMFDHRAKPYLRALVAVALQTLVDVRWSRIRVDPVIASPAPMELAKKALDEVERRVS